MSATLDYNGLFQLLARQTGSTFATITYRTKVELKDRTQKGKRGLPKVEAWKINCVNVNTNFHYVEGVERRLEKEGKPEDAFKRGTSWHQAVLDQDGRITPFCQHPTTGEVYFRVQHLQTIGEPEYRIDENYAISFVQAEPYLEKKSSYANQGLDDPLKFLTFKLSNLLSISIGGEH